MVKQIKKLKEKLSEIIFGVSTPAGRAFDVVLVILIFLSILLVMLESVPSIQKEFGKLFYILEWAITAFFSLEYILRIWIVSKPSRYIFSFYGIIDFLAILPSFVGVFIANTHGLMVIRGLRLLRIFRILKLSRYTKESSTLLDSLKASRAKISVFLFAVLMLVVIIGTLMYIIEGPQNGFVSIPKSVYWAIVTLTTVGYGDMAPTTNLGQFLASFVMIVGYGVIAVPTGIVTAEMSFQKQKREKPSKKINCVHCGCEEHIKGAKYCYACGKKLEL